MYKYKATKVNGVKYDEHRLVMEIYLCRPLLSNEVVHHKNKDRKDNRIDNLELHTKSSHAKFHSNNGDFSHPKKDIIIIPHGTHHGYAHYGCRCRACKNGHNKYMKNYVRKQ